VRGFAALFAVRLFLGIGESVTFPSFSKILAGYVPENFRGMANGICLAGMKCGPAIGALGMGLMMSRYGWRLVFLALGCASLLWVPLWFAFRPRDNIHSYRKGDFALKLSDLAAQRSFWGASLGHFSNNYLLYFMVTWLPMYLVAERSLSIRAMSVIAALYYLADGLAGASAGWLTDHLIRKGNSVSRVRKSAMLAGNSLAALGLVGCAFAGSQTYFAWLILIGIGSGTAGFGIFAFSQTLAGPKFAGKWTGFQNGIANLAGVVGPALTGFLVGATGHYKVPLLLAASVVFLGGIAWATIVGPLREVDWHTRDSAQVPVPEAAP
jgi:MFS family permease